ncbi:ATP-binding protein [Candidatus Woesearchaeota archaeon]|nr:ATP-binding protein [Candidatus Woesearchaeota archaeon]
MTKKTVKVRRGISKEFHENLGKSLFLSPYEAIIQGIDNAWDADAPLVEIIIDDKNKSLLIRDNGEGMNLEDLKHFNTYGTNIKKLNPRTRTGRLKIGDAGVGKEFIRYLCFGYQMSTVKKGKGKKYHTKEVFVRKTIQHSILTSPKFEEMNLNEKQKDKYIERIVKRVLDKRESPHTIPELNTSLLIEDVEEEYGSLEKIINQGLWGKVSYSEERITDQKKHGTEIIMKPLGSKKGKITIETDKLADLIKQKFALQLSPAFRVKMNDIEIETPIPKEAIVYEIKDALEKCGPIRGHIYYLPHKTIEKDVRGIHLVVGRTLGEGGIVKLEEMALGFAARTYGFIEVESLKPDLGFDKQRIQKGTEELLELKSHIKNIARGIYTNIKREQEKKEEAKLRNFLKEATDWVEKRLDKKTKIELAEPSVSGPFAKYMETEEDGAVIYINKEKRIEDDRNLLAHLKAEFRRDCGYAIAKHRAEQFKEFGMKRFIDMLDEMYFEEDDNLISKNSRTLAQIFEGIGDLRLETRPDMLEIYPLRLYPGSELSEITGRNLLVFRRLAEAGLFNQRPSETYKGAEAIEILQKIRGHKLLVEIIRENFARTSVTRFQHIETKLIKNLRRYEFNNPEKKISYIEKLGNTMPVYLVKNGFEEIFITKFFDEKIELIKKDKKETIGVHQASNYIYEATGMRIQPKQLSRMSTDPDFPFLKMTSTDTYLKAFHKSAVEQLIPIIEKNKKVRQEYQIV